MKSIILSLAALAAPAFANTQNSFEDKLMNEATIIESVVTKPTNGGINPKASGLEFTFQAMKGSNPCFARNTILTGRSVVNAGKVYVYIERKSIDPLRICTMQYAPVYTEVKFNLISMQRGPINLVNFKDRNITNLSSIDAAMISQVSLISLESRDFQTQVIATVLQGGNKCEADATQIKLVFDKTQQLIVAKKAMIAEVICPEVYSPQYKTYHLTIDSSDFRKIAVVNFRGAKSVTLDKLQFSYVGTVENMFAIGGETTGYGLRLEDGTTVEIDPAPFGNDSKFPAGSDLSEYIGTEIRVAGFFETRSGVERKNYKVFVITQFEPKAVLF